MKTVLLNGSPRKSGDTAALLALLRERLGGDVTQFDAYTCNIAPCNGCGYCDNHKACAIDDDMPRLLAAINEADVVVLASPIYFTELTGPLLGVTSRLQYVWASRTKHGQPVLQNKPRQGIILLTGGGMGPFDKAADTAARLLRQMGATVAGTVCSLHTDTLPAARDADARQALESIVEQIKKDAVKGRCS